MRKRSIAAVGAVAAAITLASGTTAQAHDASWGWRACGVAYLQNCGTVYISNSHRTLTVCDEEADGLGWWAKYKRTDGVSGIIKDSNGSEAGCGKGTAPSGVSITQIQRMSSLAGGTTLGNWITV